MDLKDATTIAARNLTKNATLDELRQAVRDLRALSPNSALADLVEAKIDSVSADDDRTKSGERERLGRKPGSGTDAVDGSLQGPSLPKSP
jgi:hypothetical protein